MAAAPYIYSYNDLRAYLNDQVEHLLDSVPQNSIRKIAMEAGIHHATLSRMLRGHIAITEKALTKLSKVIEVSKEDLSFLFALRDLSEAQTQPERVAAFEKISRNKKFKAANKDNLIDHNFLSNWYFPVIRELARTSEFKKDANWVRKKLGNKITKSDAELALHFLFKHDLITENTDGSFSVSQPTIKCDGGVFRLAMSEYHDQLLNIARDSIYDVPRELRQIMSQTLALPHEKVAEVREILMETAEKLSKIQVDEDQRDSVYQISLLAFPVTDVSEESA